MELYTIYSMIAILCSFAQMKLSMELIADSVGEKEDKCTYKPNIESWISGNVLSRAALIKR